MVGTDAAPDEMKAVRLTRYTRLKNIKVRVRDGAHAAGRSLCRAILQQCADSIEPKGATVGLQNQEPHRRGSTMP